MNFINRSSSKNLHLLKKKKNYFVTINPYKKPNFIIDETVFEHPIFSTETLIAQKEVMYSGQNNTYFCGFIWLWVSRRWDPIICLYFKIISCDLPEEE